MSIFTQSLIVLSLVLSVSVTPVIAVQAKPENPGSARNAAALKSPKPSSSPSLKLQACEARETGIKTRMSSLTRMANNMLAKFDSISTRVKDYYVSSGKTVANYSTLVSAIDTKRSAVGTALTAAQTDVDGFNCDLVNPRTHMNTYQQHMKTVKGALKEYRTSIKNLIVAVRSATGDTMSSTEKSPKPSKSPRGKL